jgi:hypothetical protein
MTLTPQRTWEVADSLVARLGPRAGRLRDMTPSETAYLRKSLQAFVLDASHDTWHEAIRALVEKCKAFRDVWQPIAPALVVVVAVRIHGPPEAKVATQSFLHESLDGDTWPSEALLTATIARPVTLNSPNTEARLAHLQRSIIVPTLEDAGYDVRLPVHDGAVSRPHGERTLQSCAPANSDLWVFLHLQGVGGSWRAGAQYERARTSGRTLVVVAQRGTEPLPCLFTSHETMPSRLVLFHEETELQQLFRECLEGIAYATSLTTPTVPSVDSSEGGVYPALLLLPKASRHALADFAEDKQLDSDAVELLAQEAIRRTMAAQAVGGLQRRLPPFSEYRSWLDLARQLRLLD